MVENAKLEMEKHCPVKICLDFLLVWLYVICEIVTQFICHRYGVAVHITLIALVAYFPSYGNSLV